MRPAKALRRVFAGKRINQIAIAGAAIAAFGALLASIGISA